MIRINNYKTEQYKLTYRRGLKLKLRKDFEYLIKKYNKNSLIDHYAIIKHNTIVVNDVIVVNETIEGVIYIKDIENNFYDTRLMEIIE